MISGMHVAQAGIGIAAAFGGYKIGSAVVERTRREDITGAPTREVGRSGAVVFEQQNPLLTDRITKGLLGVGALAAGTGAVLAVGGAQALTGKLALVRALGGAGLAAAGAGLVAGSIAAADRTANITLRPSHEPVTGGVAITPTP